MEIEQYCHIYAIVVYLDGYYMKTIAKYSLPSDKLNRVQTTQ